MDVSTIILSMNIDNSETNIRKRKRELRALGLKAEHDNYIGWYAVMDWNWKGN